MADRVQKIKDHMATDLVDGDPKRVYEDAIGAVLELCEKWAWNVTLPGGKKMLVEVAPLLGAIGAALGVREDPED